MTGEENPKGHCPLRFSSPEPPPFLNPNWWGMKKYIEDSFLVSSEQCKKMQTKDFRTYLIINFAARNQSARQQQGSGGKGDEGVAALRRGDFFADNKADGRNLIS